MKPDAKVVLITGASSGIGLATAILLQEKGCRVFGTSRSSSKTSQTTFEMLALDVNSDESVKGCVKGLLEETDGRVDVLVNNAGFMRTGGIEETTLEEAKMQFETDFWGHVRMAKAVLPAMRRHRSGKIINIGSLAAFVPVPFLGYHEIPKFALEGFSEVLRQELESLGIWVSIVEPGFSKTNIFNAASDTTNKIQDYDGMRERVYAALRKHEDAGQDPTLVAKTVLKIIETKNPKLHYPVGKEKYALMLKRILPQSTLESQVRRMFDVDR